jgi:threonine synthase
MNKWLECKKCGKTYTLNSALFVCSVCEEKEEYIGLEVRYDYAKLEAGFRKRMTEGRGRSMWAYRDLLPVEDEEEPVTLGEGATPIIPLLAFNKQGYKNVYYKNESLNPTGSHKDRFNSIMMTKARELGYKNMTCSSTGNHGLSAAAYAARAGLRSVIFFPPETPKLMVDMASHYGSMAVITQWHARDAMVAHLSSKGWFTNTTQKRRPVSVPYGIEGYKTIAFEIVSELGKAPDKVLVPVAGGSAFYSIYKGFRDLVAMKVIERVPEMIACQASGANVLEQAYLEQRTEVGVQARAYSLATSTREETVGDFALDAIYGSGGRVVAVTDLEIQDAMRLVAREGFCVEAASAIPVACLNKLVEQGAVSAEETVVCLLTSNGAKSPDVLADLRSPAVRIEASVDTLDQALKRYFYGENDYENR